jgi:hypothetical protein
MWGVLTRSVCAVVTRDAAWRVETCQVKAESEDVCSVSLRSVHGKFFSLADTAKVPLLRPTPPRALYRETLSFRVVVLSCLAGRGRAR